MPRTGKTADLLVAAGLFAGTVLYASIWPRDLLHFDEGLVLYESARILDGDVPYRDFFEMVTPAVWYLLALLYRVFGTDMATARGMMAVVHGLIVVATFAACRRLGVRRSLATAAAAFHMAAGFPAFAITTPHWVSTLVSLAAFHVALGYDRAPSRLGAVLLGALAGVAIAVQQQKGLFLLAAVAAFAAARAVIDGGAERPRRPLAAATRVAAAALVTLAPGALYLLVAAGPAALLRALVLFPLTGYREFHATVAWGQHFQVPSYHPYPAFMAWLPIVLVLLVLRALAARFRYGEVEAWPRLVLLSIFCAFPMIGTVYNPDYTHLAMVAPLYVVALADLAEWTIGHALGGAASRLAGWAIAAALLVVFASRMNDNLRDRRRIYSVRARTDFGIVDFMLPREVAQIEALRDLLRKEPASEIFIYPLHPAAYLMIGRRNPTPFQVVLANYTRDEQVEELIRILEARKVRYVAVIGLVRGGVVKPFWAYLTTHYRRAPLGELEGRKSPLFERIDAAGASG